MGFRAGKRETGHGNYEVLHQIKQQLGEVI